MRTKEGNKEVVILNASISIFAKTGFHHAKISKIAKLAKVSIGSIYVYYENKDDLLYKIFDKIWGGLYKKLKELVSRENISMVEKYDAMIDMIFDTFTENSSIAIVISHEQQSVQMRSPKKFTPYYEKFVSLGEKIVKEGIKKGIFNSDINVNIFRHFLLGAFRDLISSWAISPKKFPLNRLRKNIKYLSKYGLLIHK